MEMDGEQWIIVSVHLVWENVVNVLRAPRGASQAGMDRSRRINVQCIRTAETRSLHTAVNNMAGCIATIVQMGWRLL